MDVIIQTDQKWGSTPFMVFSGTYYLELRNAITSQSGIQAKVE
jgi:hypothetical protein